MLILIVTLSTTSETLKYYFEENLEAEYLQDRK